VGSVVLAGRYLLRERIGAGGMGEVWRATDDVLHRTVAVKLILPALLDEPGFLRRFLAEARAMASVRHPGVVAIHDFHGDHAGAYLVMEYVEGEPLSRVLNRVGRLGTTTSMDLVRQAALALQAVHDRGIVHRDVKPANLLIRADGSLALADFGIAVGTAGNSGLTASGAVLGTPSYLAPEQVLGQAASPRSDVYALGVIGYECLAGRRPFVGENPFAVAMQRVGQAPPPLGPDVPPPVARVIDRALAPDPSLRWSSAAEFAAAAERALAGQPVGRVYAGGAAAAASAPVVAPAVPDQRRGGAPPDRRRDEAAPDQRRAKAPAGGRRRRTWALVAAAVAVVLAAGGVVGWKLLDQRDRSTGTGTFAGGQTPGPGGPGGPGPGGGPGGPGPGGGPGGGPGPRGPLPKGFIGCGDALCPATPMCWHGLVQIGNAGQPPSSALCTEPHYWETFAATYVPADATTQRDLSHLMERGDMAAFCSPEAMAAHSRDPARTRGWRREAWPIPVDAFTVLIHCLAGAPDGETPGAVFRTS